MILAMVFLFVALRLWSVLGRRTGHEQPVAKPIETPGRPSATITAQGADSSAQGQALADPLIEPGAVAGVRAISEADREFDAARFVEGAQAAYRMILEAFWRGDEEELSRLTDDDVRDAFGQAIAARREAGHVVDNRLVSIERAVIDKARLSGSMAYVTVRFDADIAAVTRNEAGEVVAGSMTDAVPTHDVWTFSRHVGASDPNWILVETDEAA
ncbi:MAG: Tim44/TimA family putative adaptor protein [Sphingomonadaceae bacterium]